MLLQQTALAENSNLIERKKASRFFSDHLPDHKNGCSFCGFLNEFNLNSFLDAPHVERKILSRVPDLNYPELVDAWWME